MISTLLTTSLLLLGTFPLAQVPAAGEPLALVPAHQTEAPPPREFQRLEQPLAWRVAIATGGILLIMAEGWWFLGQPRTPATPEADPAQSNRQEPDEP